MSTDLVSIQAKLKAELAMTKDTVQAPSGRRISTKGKVFTMPDGKSGTGPIQAVILDFRNFNKYYTANYNPQDIKPPICFAINKTLDMKPHEDVAEAQAESCAECPHNQWGSAPNGGKGKACRNTVRLAITPPDASASDEPMIIDVSPTGLRSWSALVNALSAEGLLPVQVVTEIAFDANAAYPTLVFKAVEPHDKLEQMWTMREKAQLMLDATPEAGG